MSYMFKSKPSRLCSKKTQITQISQIKTLRLYAFAVKKTQISQIKTLRPLRKPLCPLRLKKLF